MTCSVCGEVCRCSPESSVPGVSLSRPEGNVAVDETTDTRVGPSTLAESSEGITFPAESAEAWRGEVAARLTRYRARRKIRPPRYPSLRLPFETSADRDASTPGSQRVYEPVSEHALALDGTHGHVVESEPVQAFVGQVPIEQPVPGTSALATPLSPSPARTAKIIEFPKVTWGPPPAPPDQLAEPVADRPRILEAPEVVPPPPALGGITIDPPAAPEDAKRPGIDVPLSAASTARRIAAAMVDGVIILAASALFGFIFWKVTAIRPPKIQLLALAGALPWLLWAAYQYLMVVYSATTPGWRVAGLRLARFDGSAPSRRLRRWRVFASWLSAISLGMGYAWVFLDEDVLCWHDRATHTYLAPRSAPPTPGK